MMFMFAAIVFEDSTFELEFKFRPNDFKVGENKISLNERQEDILLITNLMVLCIIIFVFKPLEF